VQEIAHAKTNTTNPNPEKPLQIGTGLTLQDSWIDLDAAAVVHVLQGVQRLSIPNESKVSKGLTHAARQTLKEAYSSRKKGARAAPARQAYGANRTVGRVDYRTIVRSRRLAEVLASRPCRSCSSPL
jgi:hypothetical protein